MTPAEIDRLPLEELRRLAHHQRCLINAFRRQNSDQLTRIRDLEQQVERLRDALGVILAGLTDALGDPMGARPSQVATLYSIASHAMRPIQSDSPEEADRG